MEAILAYDLNNGISKNGIIPWKSKTDLNFFYNITKGNIVIMGKNTYLNIGKPLTDRINIIVSTTLINININDKLIIVSSYESALIHAKTHWPDIDIYICGGYKLYNQALSHADNIIMVKLKADYECDLFFPHRYIYGYKVNTIKNTELFDIYKYNNNHKMQGEHAYLSLLDNILNNGKLTHTRNGNTLCLFAPPEIKFNLLDGFPLLTTKRMFWKGIVEELLMFINGITDSKYLSDRGVKIWEPNTTSEFIKSRGLDYEPGDMGPMYGWNWRHFGAEYLGKDADYTDKGFDQLANLIKLIKTDPTSRRLLLTSFDPSKVPESVLPPCHSLPVQFNIDDTFIDCKMTQRSADMFLGVPFNIASTALLLTLIGKLTGYTPRYMTMSFGDAHIYELHKDQCARQLLRLPKILPRISIIKKLTTISDMETLTIDEIIISDYRCYPGIKAEMIA